MFLGFRHDLHSQVSEVVTSWSDLIGLVGFTQHYYVRITSEWILDHRDWLQVDFRVMSHSLLG